MSKEMIHELTRTNTKNFVPFRVISWIVFLYLLVSN